MVSATDSLLFALSWEMLKLYALFLSGFPIAALGNQITAALIPLGAVVSAVALVAILYKIIHDATV